MPLKIADNSTASDSALQAAGVMYACRNKVLLMKRINDGTWAFPGGKVEDGETIEQGARRESLEETGHSPEDLLQVDMTNQGDYDFTTYLSNVGTTFNPIMNDEHDEYMWGDFDNLPMPLHPGVKATLDKYRASCGLDSAQKIDQNGFITVDANPISRAGIFPYLGKSIDRMAEPEKIYNVYRPASEVNNSDTLNSMKLLPLIDEHVMVGIKKAGMMPAEEKGIQGSTGENVFFKDGVLYATLKIFSQTLADMIKMGKKALSLGYHCKFIKQSGIFNGQTYDYIQTQIRGNHLALVNEARCDVAVLDNSMAFDSFDISLSTEEVSKMADKEKDDTKEKPGDNKKPDAKDTDEHGEMTLQELHDLMKQHMPMLKKMNDMMDKHFGGADDEKKDEKTDPAMDKKAKDDADFKGTTNKDIPTGNGKGVTDAEEEEKKKAEDKKAKDEAEAKEKEKGAMDSAIKDLTNQVETLKKEGFKSIMKEAAQRDELAEQVSQFVGTFDHSEMTKQEVATYGVEKLGIKCDKGQEIAALGGYLHGRKPDTTAFGMDSGNFGKKGKYAESKTKRSAA